MALLDDDLPQADTAARYQPRWLDLYSSPKARLRTLRLLAEAPAGRTGTLLGPSTLLYCLC